MRNIVILCAALGLAQAVDLTTYDGFGYNEEGNSYQNLAQVGTEAEFIGGIFGIFRVVSAATKVAKIAKMAKVAA